MTETQSPSPEFSGCRAYLWPVHSYELKKLIPMLLIFFFITLDYNILRTLKESVLITAKHSGAEVIPFAKVWGVFPGAVLTTLLYTWLSNRFSRESVCYIMLSLFMSYFFIFAFVLYPIRDTIHPHATADFLQTVLPAGFKGLIALFRYWTFTIFYVASELWSSAILAVLIWGFANQITKLSEAKRFYGLLGVGGNLSGIFAGLISVYFCTTSIESKVYVGEDAWHQSLIILISIVLICGLLAIALFRWMNVHVLTDKRYYDPTTVKSEGEVQGKLSFRDSIKILFSSRYLACIALIVIFYNVVINLTEVMWKSQVRELYSHPTDYTIYMNHIVSLIGVVATLCSLFVSNSAIRKYGWTFTAMLTPIVLGIGSLAFFGFFFLDKTAPYMIISSLGVTPLAIVVFIGSVQNILSRAAKYSVFDATKEMAFVPLDPETKLLGKAAIDGFGSRFGKSGGSMILQTLLLFFTTLTASAPFVALALFLMLGIWSITVKALGQRFRALSENLDTEQPVAPAPTSPTILEDNSILQKG